MSSPAAAAANDAAPPLPPPAVAQPADAGAYSKALEERLRVAEQEVERLRQQQREREMVHTSEVQQLIAQNQELRNDAATYTTVANMAASQRQSEEVERLQRLTEVQEQQLLDLREKVRSREAELQTAWGRVSAANEQVAQLTLEADQAKKEAVRAALMARDEGHQMELRERLDRASVSVLGVAERHLQGRELQTQQLLYELDKRDKIVSTMRNEMRGKDEALHALRQELQKAHEALELAERGKTVTSEKSRSDAEAMVQLNAAQLHQTRAQAEVLQERCRKLEELLRDKDDETRSFRTQLCQRDEVIGRLNRDLNDAKFELSVRDMQINESEKSGINRESHLASEMRRLQERHDKTLKMECERRESVIGEKDAAIAKLQEAMKDINGRLERANTEAHRLSMTIQSKESQNLELREQLQDMEAKMYATDLTNELELTRQTESELRRKLREERERNEVLKEDSRLLQKARHDYSGLQSELVEHKSVIARLNEQIVNLKREKPLALTYTSHEPLYPYHHPSNGFASHAHPHQQHDNVAPLNDHTQPPAAAAAAASSASQLQPPLRYPQIQFPSTTSGATGDAGPLAGYAPLSAAEEPQPSHAAAVRDKRSKADHHPHQKSVYVAHPGDRLDEMVAEYVNTTQIDRSVPIRRIDEGLYIIGTRRVSCKILNGQLMVRVGGGIMSLADFVSSERANSESVPLEPERQKGLQGGGGAAE
ncbi:unnamed protein product [Vitrella brassicaformis CCMP3155]|uniref:GAR domain-containing protein n=2 Tax=Vitrella brassicaformis TaxID=1169539 RepID=A0A0G4EW77_VITBC|nr:unnamed protein product [Vitrella brassicaformis CCMP3155]|eukprot:CEM02605.1 unnamed protein product [Vitrella brassicaformis CCMP3155]